MKCINCQTDSKLKDRTANSNRCAACKHPFAFEPTAMKTVKITDPLFKKVIDELSVNHSLFFTQKQFSYFLDRRLRRTYGKGLLVIYIFFNLFLGIISSAIFKGNLYAVITFNFILQAFVCWLLFKGTTDRRLDNRGRRLNARLLRRLGVFVLIAGTLVSLLLAPSFGLFAIAIGMGLGAIYLGNQQLAAPPTSQEFRFTPQECQDWLTRWAQANGQIDKLLPAPRQSGGTAAVNPDVTAYSFDRLVVCDSAEIAQMLIANNFHFENNCAILSITGYPQDIFDTTMQMLRRNPGLKVYALHDCTPRGIGLVQRLQTSDKWFKGSSVMIMDVGLAPRQILSTKGLFIQTSAESMQAAKQMPTAQKALLANDEVKWLEAGNYVELESFTPQRLIQVLNLGIAGSRDMLSDGYDSGVIYGPDTFG
jgi:hypothetical protein